jgi:SAM-dependent methyltransferase
MGAVDLDIAFAAIRQRYEGWLVEHGAESSRAVGWVDPAMQALRFDLLAQVMEGDEPVTVADFGCGTGALFRHLAERAAPPPLAAYTGYDIVPAMVETARGLHTDPRARFEVGTEVREEVDYVIVSGTFTVHPGVGDADWEAHVQGVLHGLWERSRRGLGFNLFAGGTDVKLPRHAGAPEAWAHWCASALPGALVALHYGPPLADFTVLMRRAR